MIISGVATGIAGVSFQSTTFQLRCRGAPRGEARCFGENYDWTAQCYYWLQAVGLNLFVIGRSFLSKTAGGEVRVQAFAIGMSLVYYAAMLLTTAARGYFTSSVFLFWSWAYLVGSSIWHMKRLNDTLYMVAWASLGLSFFWRGSGATDDRRARGRARWRRAGTSRG